MSTSECLYAAVLSANKHVPIAHVQIDNHSTYQAVQAVV